MNELGFNTTIEEGDRGQFELFRHISVENSDYWVSYIKAGHGNFITLSNVERKLAGMD